jgi:hypothetical protein
MRRCVFLRAALGGCVSVLLAAPLPAAAQLHRNFPADALRGKLVVLAPPMARLNGADARLAPGARIRGPDNLLVLSGAIVGAELVVNYTLDTGGLVHDVWILTDEERARRPWPTTPAEARSWSFDAFAQTWSKP